MGNTQSASDEDLNVSGHDVGKIRTTKPPIPASPSESSILVCNVHNLERDKQNAPIGASMAVQGVNLLEESMRSPTVSASSPPRQHRMSAWRQTQVELLAANVVRSLSRSGSQARKTTSAEPSMSNLRGGSDHVTPDGSKVNIQSAIAIIEELRKTASPEDLLALHEALLPVPSRDSLTSQSGNDAHEHPDTSTAAPNHRKSFAQPLATTRYTKGERNVLRKSVPAAWARSTAWTKDMMGSSPLTRLSSLDAPQLDELDPPPELYANRAHTPSENEYSQLGSLKHGSLMVVNGPPSPNPSVATPGNLRRLACEECDEDFFTASDHSGSRPSSRRQLNTTIDSPGWHDSSPSQASIHENGKEFWSSRTRPGSPLKQEFQHHSHNVIEQADVESIYSHNIRPARSMISSHSQLPDRKLFDEPGAEEVRQVIMTHHPQSAVSLATEYMSEMPPSPFKAEDDDLEEVPQTFSVSPSVILDAPPISPRKPLRSHPAADEVSCFPYRDYRQPLGLKTDSGYCSSASTSVVDSVSPIKMHQSNLSTVESLTDGSHEEQHYHVAGTVDLATRIGKIDSLHDIYHEQDAEPGIIESIENDGMVAEKVKRARSWRKSVRRSLPRLLSSESAASAVSKSTSPSIGGGIEPKPRKLQKRRPLSQPPINMNDRHIVDNSIPRIPSTVFSRHSGRLSASPAMQHLQQTHENPIDFVDDTSLLPSSTTKSSLPSCFFPDADPETPTNPPAHRLSFKRPSFRRARTQLNETELRSTGIADFGTVSHSLGTSPYDAAYSGPRRSISGGATQPHHLSTKAAPGRPREGWDAQTASKFAQMRSRERAGQQYDGKFRADRSPISQRPTSVHGRLSHVEDRQQQRSLQRPKSMHAQSTPIHNHYDQVPESRPVFQLPSPHSTQSHVHTSYHEGDTRSVKKLVDAFEQKAVDMPAPPPIPSPQPDWTDSSRIWRERKLNAQMSVTTTSLSSRGQSTITTTTTTTFPSTVPRTTTATSIGVTPTERDAKSVWQTRQDQPGLTGSVEGTSDRHRTFGYHYIERNSFGPREMGNTKHKVPATRRFYGVDFGDVPIGVI